LFSRDGSSVSEFRPAIVVLKNERDFFTGERVMTGLGKTVLPGVTTLIQNSIFPDRKHSVNGQLQSYIMSIIFISLLMTEPGLPKILQAHVSLMLPVVIPDLLTNPGILKPEYRFLLSASGYAQYYQEHECDGRNTGGQAHIPALCASLSPLKKRHAMHSYWKTVRRSVEIARSAGKDISKLLYLLPLEIHIPAEPLAVDGKKYEARAYVYLFPFGCCIVNLDVQVSDMTFHEFLSFISNLKRANIVTSGGFPCPELSGSKNRGVFKKFAEEITKIINTGLSESAGKLEFYKPHTLIFIKRTLPEFSDMATDHRIAIAAALEGGTFIDASGKNRNKIDLILQNQIEGYRSQELLFFTPPCSLFIASPDWNVDVSGDPGTVLDTIKVKKLDKKMTCMMSNYQSCLNVLFAVNRVLDSTVVKEQRISPDKLDDLKKSIGVVFPEDPAGIHYRHVYEKVAPVIKLKENIKVLR
jgi:hypothetical protein